MKVANTQSLAALVLAVSLAVGGLGLHRPAHAHHDASALSTLSALPIASVVVAGSGAAAALAVAPVALSVAGAVLVVKVVEVSARGTIYVLERVYDGARVSVQVSERAIGASALAVGTAVTVSVVGAGVVLSAAGTAIAFIPNALGRALLHDERVTS